MSSPPRSPDAGAVRRLFDRWARDGRGEGMEEGHRDIVLQMLDRAGLRAEHHVLDLGCGTGWTVRLLASVLGGGRAYGVDPSPEMIAVARATPHPPRVAFTVAAAEDLPFADASLDRVVSMESLYYWQDVDAGLAEVLRVLRPGGRFLAAIEYWRENPWTAHWGELMELPLHHFSAAEWLRRLEAAGFAETACDRLIDRRPPRPEADFQAGRCFRSHQEYAGAHAAGALLLLGSRPTPA